MAYKLKEYEESESVKEALNKLNQQIANKPGEYQSQWQSSLNAALDKILNREEFKYDLNGDALYQQYKNNAITNGRMAMMDTMGQAQSMTGGYGNSYAQSVGQQAYDGYLQSLNDVVPELYQLAMDRYNMESSDLYNRLGVLQQQESQDYGRYQDRYNQWLTERDFLSGRYDAERDYDYGKYADGRDFAYGQYIDDRNYQFQQEQAALEQSRWQAEFDEAKRQWEAAQAAKTSSGGGGGSYSGNQGYDTETVRKAQQFVGTTVDGMWGKNSTAAAKAMGYSSLSDVIAAMGESDSQTVGSTGGSLSEAGQRFMNNLPYAHAGSDQETWKKTVSERLDKAYNNGNGSLTAEDVILIVEKLGIKS